MGEVATVIFDYSKLSGRICEKGFTQTSLAKNLGISQTTLSLKLNNKSFFSQPEIIEICTLLEIDKENIEQFFFSTKV